MNRNLLDRHLNESIDFKNLFEKKTVNLNKMQNLYWNITMQCRSDQ